MAGVGYALDLSSPVVYVAAALAAASPAPVPISALVMGYEHPIPGDLVRVQLHEGCGSPHAAVEWLIRRAVQELEKSGQEGRTQLVVADEEVRFAEGMSLSKLRWGRKKVPVTLADKQRVRPPGKADKRELVAEVLRRVRTGQSMKRIELAAQFSTVQPEQYSCGCLLSITANPREARKDPGYIGETSVHAIQQAAHYVMRYPDLFQELLDEPAK